MAEDREEERDRHRQRRRRNSHPDDYEHNVYHCFTETDLHNHEKNNNNSIPTLVHQY